MPLLLQAESPDTAPHALLAEGLRHHGIGDLTAAAHCYQQCLEQPQSKPDALLLLGIVARQTGQFPHAIALTRAAIAARNGSKPTPHYLLNLAHAHRVAGNLSEAETACRAALGMAPNDPALHCWLAEILLAREDFPAAQQCCDNALALHPGFARAHHSIGNILSRQGRFEEAVGSYGRAIALSRQQAPEQAQFHFGLGYALQRLGNLPHARAAFLRTLQINPAFVEAHLNLGNLFYDRGLFPSAAAHYQSALRIRPAYAKAYVNLGNALACLHRTNEAIACYRRALSLNPDSATAHHGLGNALAEAKSWNEAHECLQKALELRPGSREIHNSLGNFHYARKSMSDAAQHYRRALDIDSTYARAQVNLGNAVLALGDYANARAFYHRGLSLDPASAGARYNLALAQLRNREFPAGWLNYESRWEFDELRMRRRNFRVPLWRGQPLKGKTILLHAEQGLGDTIQFVRFVPQVAARGARVILEVQPPLARLLQQVPGTEAVISYGATLPAFDFHCPLMSLPLALGTTVETIPSAEGYLNTHVGANHAAASQTLRVGIAWSGNPRNKGDALRSIPLAALHTLAELPGLSLISLQKGAGTEQLAPLRNSLPIEDASSNCEDMQETASLARTLDLVLAVDTSIAHLAGAMAIPVWIMLPWVADWRWMDGAHSPWYRSARLIRQSAAGDWASVTEQIVSALRTETQSRLK